VYPSGDGFPPPISILRSLAYGHVGNQHRFDAKDRCIGFAVEKRHTGFDMRLEFLLKFHTPINFKEDLIFLPLLVLKHEPHIRNHLQVRISRQLIA
jgi:hypothetical protein